MNQQLRSIHVFFLREPADKPSVRTSMGSQLQLSPSSTAESQFHSLPLSRRSPSPICSDSLKLPAPPRVTLPSWQPSSRPGVSTQKPSLLQPELPVSCFEIQSPSQFRCQFSPKARRSSRLQPQSSGIWDAGRQPSFKARSLSPTLLREPSPLPWGPRHLAHLAAGWTPGTDMGGVQIRAGQWALAMGRPQKLRHTRASVSSRWSHVRHQQPWSPVSAILDFQSASQQVHQVWVCRLRLPGHPFPLLPAQALKSSSQAQTD
ncbi:uncharacterized protein LOC129540309 [Moschus berezovskii]|uniref:uncharacterized protein LOC129540309 n=1 Tax=Moschus berezovskii TaxID=68408 RepID=UPI0024443E26|nr:uncharacterized protein LOC129540309 [Moschus berezovskii]